MTKLDRLGRSTRELLELIERIGKAGASFRSLGDPLWDTRPRYMRRKTYVRLRETALRLEAEIAAVATLINGGITVISPDGRHIEHTPMPDPNFIILYVDSVHASARFYAPAAA